MGLSGQKRARHRSGAGPFLSESYPYFSTISRMSIGQALTQMPQAVHLEE